MAKLQLTFDDGPLPTTSLDSILATVDAEGIVAAFFVIGAEAEADHAATKKITDDDHVVGNHSWDHLEPSTAQKTDDEIKQSFKKAHDEIKAAVGSAPKHWRAPRLEQIPRLTGLLTTGAGALYTLSHCDIHADSKDSQGASTADEMFQNIQADIAAHPNRTVYRLLFHVKQTTASALPQTIAKLKAAGHVLVDFSQTA